MRIVDSLVVGEVRGRKKIFWGFFFCLVLLIFLLSCFFREGGKKSVCVNVFWWVGEWCWGEGWFLESIVVLGRGRRRKFFF